MDNMNFVSECKRLLGKLNEVDERKSFKEKLRYAFKEYVSKLALRPLDNKGHTQIQKETCDLQRGILRVIDHYLKGNVQGAYVSFSKLWSRMREYACTDTLKLGKKLYRLRKIEPNGGVRMLMRAEMFHVPFSQRGIVGNYRYSISGYPCLYCGFSVYTCWMEMRCPHVMDMYFTALRLKREAKLLDLRVPNGKLDADEEYKFACMFPLILACSVRVDPRRDKDSFKEEYIIPQILLHTLAKGKEYDGCVYTSTQINSEFDSLCKNVSNDNVVMLPRGDQKRGLALNLLDMFEMCQPSSFDMEIIRHGFNMEAGMKGTDYSRTLFGRIEHQLNQLNFKDIIE